MDTLCNKNSNFDVFMKIFSHFVNILEPGISFQAPENKKFFLYSYIETHKSLKFYPAAMDTLSLKYKNFNVFVNFFLISLEVSLIS
jgi:hypothetical protein